MRPDSTDLLTWAILMFVLANQNDGATAGLNVLVGVGLIIYSFIEERRERKRGWETIAVIERAKGDA